MERPVITTRREWFKVLACESHTWPVQTCDRCWERVFKRLENDCQKDTGDPGPWA